MNSKRQKPTPRWHLAIGALTTVTAIAILVGTATTMEYPETAARPTEGATQSTLQSTPTLPHEPPTVVSAAEKADIWEPEQSDVDYIAKTIFGEASVVPSRARQAAVAWCILNRVDSPDFPDTIEEVVTAPYQFSGYYPDCDPPEEYRDLARDVLLRWHREQQGETNAGRTIPKGWCFFTGDGRENHFTAEWRGTTIWDWTLPDPYEEATKCE